VSSPPPDADATARRQAFVERMTREERVLVLVRDELFAGSWSDLETDLRARLERRPSIFKLSTRIEEDLERITKLRDFERAEGVDLRSLLPRPSGTDERGDDPAPGGGETS